MPSSYGAANGDQAEPTQTFSISEPYQTHGDTSYLRGAGKKSGFCCRGEQDGLKAIIISMFVFAIGVTVALIVQIAAGVSRERQDTDHAVSDHPICTKIGYRVMSMGGNAVDAAVAGSICLAVAAPHIAGIGGGGVMLIHQHRNSNVTKVIDFREMSPAGAENDRYTSDRLMATTGLGSIAVPGFLKGLEHAHKKYGAGVRGMQCCTWQDLVYLTIKEIPNMLVSHHFDNATHFKIHAPDLDPSTNLKQFLRNGEISADMQLMDLPLFDQLVDTLKVIAAQGADAFYRGIIANQTVKELQGQLTLDDLANYTVIERKAISTHVGKFQILTTPAPTAGPQMLAFVNSMEEFKRRYGFHKVDINYLHNVSMILRKTEMFQLGLGEPDSEKLVENRTLWMTDKANVHKFVNVIDGSDVGFESLYPMAESIGANMVAMDRMDNYVSVVTSLNTWFGSKVMTSNGILFNNALSNFVVHEKNSPELRTANQMAPFKRPLTNQVLALAVNSERICGSRFAVGGSTPDAVGEVLADLTVFGTDLQQALEQGRIQVAGGRVMIENAFDGFNERLVKSLRRSDNVSFVDLPFSSVNAIEKDLDNVFPVHDARSYMDTITV